MMTTILTTISIVTMVALIDVISLIIILKNNRLRNLLANRLKQLFNLADSNDSNDYYSEINLLNERIDDLVTDIDRVDDKVMDLVDVVNSTEYQRIEDNSKFLKNKDLDELKQVIFDADERGRKVLDDVATQLDILNDKVEFLYRNYK